MPRLAPLAAALAIAAGGLHPGRLAAQTEFAVPLAPGTLRIDFTPVWSSWDHRFQPGASGPVPITADFTADSLGTANLPFLTHLQDTLRQATGLGGAFALNLGHPLIALNASVRTLPIGLEMGISRRLSIGVTVPIVRSRVDASFNLDTALARRSNVGHFPLADTTFRSQIGAAIDSLQKQAASGPAALRAQAQAAIAALAPFLALVHQPFLPRDSTVAAESIQVRLARADSAYAALAAQYQGLGVTLPVIGAPLSLPDTALIRDDLERLYSDPSLPVAADTFGTVVRTGIGDVTAHLTWQFAEAARYRGQLVLTARFPTGKAPSATNFLDLGTGTHQLGFEGAVANDLILGEHFLIHAVARGGGAASDQILMRVTPPELPIAPLSQQALIRRKPAPFIGAELDPTWTMDDAFSVRATYGFYSQAMTKHSYVNPADSAVVLLPASVLDQDTGVRWMRIGVGVTFSTVGRYAKGRASLPYSVTVSWENTVYGGAGRVPQEGIFHILIRGYLKLFK
ncbi:MAG TPA: hypothetical protein VEH62_07235 [Gemmatimonadales bacterium]|nr:hypothetical protein [Gemmatimonadales bacterium]